MATSAELLAFISLRRGEMEKACVCTFSVDLNLPYPMKRATTSYLVGYTVKGSKEYAGVRSVIPTFYGNPQQ